MFSKWFGKKDDSATEVKAPEIMGLRIGGAFELDDLKLRLIEPDLIVEGVARTQLIQAVGMVKLDESSTVLRYYTDDDGFLQVLLTGGMTEQHISDVKLWYFYQTEGVNSDHQWNELLNSGISTPETELEGYHFSRVWGGVGGDSPPVAMTETTWQQDGSESETDQFMMLYEREIKDGHFEYLIKSGEEKIIHNQADRCLVISTGLDIHHADISIIG
ncbi:YjfK family protein [Gynuella sp.]|uniref:YjfK family protein n=1 Tax=Gynuella sp. TaxID=2969146 RepID=UPI003D11B2AD